MEHMPTPLPRTCLLADILDFLLVLQLDLSKEFDCELFRVAVNKLVMVSAKQNKVLMRMNIAKQLCVASWTIFALCDDVSFITKQTVRPFIKQICLTIGECTLSSSLGPKLYLFRLEYLT